MLEELAAIDLSTVRDLRRHKEERDVLMARIETMNARRDRVSDEVFVRVQADYRARLDAIDERARPLKDKVRAEYAALRSLLERLGERLREAGLAREEIEFRHALGEFDDATRGDRLAQADSLVAACEADLGEAEAVRAEFVAAFASVEELEGPVAPEPFDVLPQSGPSAADVDAEAPDATLLTESPRGGSILLPGPGVGNLPPAFPGDSAVATGVTRPMPPDVVAEATPASPPLVQDVDVPTEDEAPGNASLAVARLEARRADGSSEEFPLQLGTTTIGRSPKNDVCLREASVSRQHAKIVFTERGFVIYDLGSENGVYVNGDRVTHRLLFDGDEIEFGPGLQPFVFRVP